MEKPKCQLCGKIASAGNLFSLDGEYYSVNIRLIGDTRITLPTLCFECNEELDKHIKALHSPRKED